MAIMSLMISPIPLLSLFLRRSYIAVAERSAEFHFLVHPVAHPFCEVQGMRTQRIVVSHKHIVIGRASDCDNACADINIEGIVVITSAHFDSSCVDVASNHS